MAKVNLYTIHWLDDWGEVYETLEDLEYREVVHYRRDAKYMHLDIKVIKQNQTQGGGRNPPINSKQL